MPYPLLAHQAPVLPLKMWRADYFNGTALVVGSVAPDLQNFWNATGPADFGHTFAGQFTFCLPLTISVVVLVGYLRLGEVIASRFGRRFTWLAAAATDIARANGFERAVMSAFVGSFSHIALDAITHDAIPARTTYHVHHLAFSMHAIVQAVVSVVGACIAIACLRKMYMQNTCDPPPRRAGAWFLVLAALLGGMFGVHSALPALRHPDWFFEAGRVYVWGYTLFLAAAAAAAGILLAAAMLAALDARQPSAGVQS